MKQLTREEAIALAESGVWKEWTSEQVATFQINQKCLCMDFSHFHKCVEEVLGRPVFTHEFAFPELKKEILGEKKAPTMEDIINLIPQEKRIIIFNS